MSIVKAVQEFSKTPFAIKKLECLEVIFGVKKLHPARKRGFLTASMKMQLKSDKGFTVDLGFEYMCSVSNKAIDEQTAVDLLERYAGEFGSKETPFNYNAVERRSRTNSEPILRLKFDDCEASRAFFDENFFHNPFDYSDAEDTEAHIEDIYTEKMTIEHILSAVDSAETRQKIHKAIMMQVTS